MRNLFGLFALFTFAALLAACGGTDSDHGADGGDSDRPLRVVYILKNTGNPYFDAINEGFQRASRDFGFEFTTVGPASPEATTQIPFIKDQIQRRVDVIAISANSPDALNPVLDQARDRGILVMCVNSDITGSEAHRDLAILPMDFEITGESQVELLGSMIGYEGDFAILSSTTDAPDQNYWIEGMRRTLEEPKYANMNLVAVVYGDDEPAKSQTEAESLLARHPNLRGIIAPTTVGVAATAQVVQVQGVYPGGPNARNGGVVVTGLGSPNLMRQYIKDGVVEAFALWDPGLQGYLSGALAAKIRRGEVQLGEGNTFMIEGVGERTFGPANLVITGPPQLFTIENIDDFHF